MPEQEGDAIMGVGQRLVALAERAVNVREDEVKALFWAFGSFFCLLTSYYILRPLRDEMGLRSGVETCNGCSRARFS